MKAHTTNNEDSSTEGSIPKSTGKSLIDRVRDIMSASGKRKLSDRDYKRLIEADPSRVSEEHYKRVLASLDVALRKSLSDKS